MTTETTSLKRAAFWSVLSNLIGQMLVLIVFLVTARFVSKEDFGVIAAAMIFVEIFRQILIESVAYGLMAKHEPHTKFFNAAFFSVLVASLVFATAIYIAAPIVALLVNQERVGDALRLVSPILVLNALGRIHEIWLAKHLQFKALAIRSVTSVCVGGVIGVWMAVQGMGLVSLVAQQVITALISATWLWLTCEWRPRLDFDQREVKRVWEMSWPLSTNATITVLGGQADVFFSSMYLGAAATGVFNAAKRILTAFNLILASGLNSVAMPAFSSLGKRHAHLGHSFLQFTSVTALIVSPLFFGLLVLSPELVLIVLGPKWIEVSPVLSVIALSGYVSAISQYTISIMLIYDKSRWVIWLTATGTAINAILLLAFAHLGLMMVATVTVLKSIILAPISYILVMRLLEERWQKLVRCIAPSLGAATLMALVLLLVRPHIRHLGPFQSLMVFIPVGGFVYLALCFLLDRKGMLNVYFTLRAIFIRRIK